MLNKKRICKYAYSRAEIVGMSGDVSFCCPDYTDSYILGNFQTQSFEEIWNGEKAKKLRQTMLDGTYEYCHLDRCCIDENLLEYVPDEISTISPPPKVVEIAPSSVCNTRCIMCRDDYGVHPIERNKSFYEKMIPKYMEVLKYAEKLNLNQCGEALADQHCIKIIQEALKINPNLKIGILSNGKLCNKETFEKIGIQNSLYWVQVSVHATTEKTYNKIVRDSNFKTLKKNLEWLSEEKKAGRIPEVKMNFVIQKYNFREMVDFAKWAKDLGLTCGFWVIRQHPKDPTNPEEYIPYHLRDRNFKKIAVHNPSHPNYEEFIEILKNPIFREDFCEIDDLLLNLKSNKKAKNRNNAFSIFRKNFIKILLKKFYKK